MRLALIVLPIFTLTACLSSSPRDKCVDQARAKLRDLNAGVHYAEFNIFRQQAYGYRVDSDDVARLQNDPDFRSQCKMRNADGTVRRYECAYMVGSEIQFRGSPVPIDMDKEPGILAKLERARNVERPIAEEAIFQCHQSFPEA